MKAQVLDQIVDLTQEEAPLRLADVEDPSPERNQVLLKVSACGVCHTELDEIEGRTAPSQLPRILGHQVVGEIIDCGSGCCERQSGERVGVAWIYHACGDCEACEDGEENLCADFQATGRDADGGYAEYMVAPEAFVCPVPDCFEDMEAAPLLCAGAIGYRSFRLTGIENGQALGLTGFGASAHLVLKMLPEHQPDTEVYVFARNPAEREFAEELGAVWTGDTAEHAPVPLHAIIDTTPAWKPVVEALNNLRPGGRLVINAIRKEAGDQDYLQNLSYHEHLWLEREIKSVANVTRRDVREFLQLAARADIHPQVESFELADANQALMELKRGKIRGAKVLRL